MPLSKKAAKMSAFLKSPERVQTIVTDIAKHFQEKVEPHGFKAMIVTPDRQACVQYKDVSTRYPLKTPAPWSSPPPPTIDYDFKQKWAMDKASKRSCSSGSTTKEDPLKILIVTAKLLTGFDAPILQTMYLDKSLKDHTLLQAICRTNRLFPEKHFGRIVDYFGIFDDAAEALKFDEESVQEVITNLAQSSKPNSPGPWLPASPTSPEWTAQSTALKGSKPRRTASAPTNSATPLPPTSVYLSKLWEALSPADVPQRISDRLPLAGTACISPSNRP